MIPAPWDRVLSWGACVRGSCRWIEESLWLPSSWWTLCKGPIDGQEYRITRWRCSGMQDT